MGMAKHILIPPRTGKTSAILASASLDCLIVSRGVHSNPYTTAIQQDLISKKQYVVVHSNFNAVRSKNWKKVYIDELLSFNDKDLEWLEELLCVHVPNVEVVAYSTPFTTFSKAAYLLAKNKIRAVKDVMLDEEEARELNKEINRLNLYMLNPSRNIIDFRKSYPGMKEGEFKEARERAKQMLGKEKFDIMYNLKILK